MSEQKHPELRSEACSGPRDPANPRDMIEFHLRWPEFRHLAISLENRPDLPENEREILRWLVALADRIGPKDLLQE